MRHDRLPVFGYGQFGADQSRYGFVVGRIRYQDEIVALRRDQRLFDMQHLSVHGQRLTGSQILLKPPAFIRADLDFRRQYGQTLAVVVTRIIAAAEYRFASPFTA